MWIKDIEGRLLNSDFIALVETQGSSADGIVQVIAHIKHDIYVLKETENELQADTFLSSLYDDLNGGGFLE